MRALKPCKSCGIAIKKPEKNYSWVRYEKRIYCSVPCTLKDPAVREKMSMAGLGRIPWNKGLPSPWTRGNKYAFLGDKAGPDAGRKRAQALFPKVKPCENCGLIKTGFRAMVRHHRDHNPLNNFPENVAFLCRGCHINEHRNDLLKARQRLEAA